MQQQSPEYSQQQPPPKKRQTPAWAIIGLVCLLLVIFIGLAELNRIITPTSTSDTSTTDTSTVASDTTVSSSGGTWTTTHTFSGNGIKQTEIFSVPGDWKIQWSCIGFDTVDGQLGVIIYDNHASIIDVAVNSSCKANGQSTGETEEHQSGSIYLKIDATGDWSITVQELQ